MKIVIASIFLLGLCSGLSTAQVIPIDYQGEIQIHPRFQDDLELESEVVTLEKRTWSGVKASCR